MNFLVEQRLGFVVLLLDIVVGRDGAIEQLDGERSGDFILFFCDLFGRGY